MTAVDLPAIRALLAGITPGEIEVERYAHGGGRVWVRPRPGIRFLMADTYEGAGNREFIAAAPSIVAQLLAVVDAALEACNVVIDNADGHKPPGPPHPSREQIAALRIRAALTEGVSDGPR